MDITELIKDHEGYRDKVYLDTQGIPTGGFGHAFLKGSSLPRYIWEQIFWDVDLKNALQDYDRLSLVLDDVRKAAVVDLCFARGLGNMLKWSEFLDYMRHGRWEDAAAYVEKTGWYSRVGRRGPRICALIRAGDWDSLQRWL